MNANTNGIGTLNKSGLHLLRGSLLRTATSNVSIPWASTSGTPQVVGSKLNVGEVSAPLSVWKWESPLLVLELSRVDGIGEEEWEVCLSRET